VTGGLAILLAVVAVVAGFLILRSISDGGEQSLDFTGSGATTDGGSNGDGVTDTTDAPDGSVAATLPPTTTVPAIVVDGASVLVANANSVGGSASAMTRALETGPGFTMVDPTNASDAIGDIAESVIYFDSTNPSAQQVAESLSRVLGNVASVTALSGTPPTRDGTLNGAGVLLMLGNDKAGKTLAELAPGLVTSPAVVTNPPVAGSTASTDG
jgi:hypothetical protein